MPADGHDPLASKYFRLLRAPELDGGGWNAKAAAADATAAALAERISVGNQDDRRRQEVRERLPHAMHAIVFSGPVNSVFLSAGKWKTQLKDTQALVCV